MNTIGSSLVVKLNSKTKLLIYDGECGLCHWAVSFLVKRISIENSSLFFISSNSELGIHLLKKNNFDPKNLDSLVLCQGDEIFLRTNAVKLALVECVMPWSFMGSCLNFIPFSDCLYNKVAKNRQKFMSKNKCDFNPNFGRFSLSKIDELNELNK